jgi:signal transduction histidine kinase
MPEKSYQVVAGFVIGIIILLIAATFIVILVAYSNKRKRRFLQEQQNMQILFKEQLLQSQLETQEQTLQHISTELHDNLGALASLIKINLLTIPLTDIDKAAQKLENTVDLTRQLIVDIKSLSVSLNSDHIAQKGLLNSIATYVDRINKTGQFNASLKVGTNLPFIENDKAIILYRMVQEILNNMIKHSKAQNLQIDIFAKDNLVTLSLSDDGEGFNMEAEIKNGNGAGLLNLEKRARIINAILTTISSPCNGTKVIIELPFSY